MAISHHCFVSNEKEKWRRDTLLGDRAAPELCAVSSHFHRIFIRVFCEFQQENVGI